MAKKDKRFFTIGFILVEAALVALSAFFAFAVVGYRTISLCLLAIGVFIAIFYFLSYFDTRAAKIIKILFLVILCLGIILFAVAEAFIVPASRTDKEPEAPYLIVLGAGVNGTVPSLSLLDRMEAALAYLERYPEAKAVLSGGQGGGEDITEAECMRRWLSEKGIGAERLIMEENSTSTQENITFSLEKIRQDGGDASGRIAIVTSEYHLYRAKYIAAAEGAEAAGIAAATRLPVLKLNYFIREAFAVVQLWIM